MGQVPLNTPFSRPADLPQADLFFPLLLGRGKLAQHLHQYLHLIDFKHKHYDESLRALESGFTDPELDRKMLACNVIWIMVSDQAIESVYRSIQKRLEFLGADLSRYTFIHSSAATKVEGMQTFHPLMTFGPSLYTLEQYQSIPFASFEGETSGPISFPFQNLHFTIPASKRAFYHACAVMMSNLPILLWNQVSSEFQKQTETEPQVFQPILKQTLSNFLALGEKALTGPIVRNDQATVQKNLASIEGTPLHPIYQTFLQSFKKENHL